MMKLVVDVDAGIDDAIALMMLLASPEVEIVAITTVCGNTSTDNVSTNVLRVLEAAGRTEIPVYAGCQASLLGRSSQGYVHHGSNGFGDNPAMPEVDRSRLQTEHAVHRLISLSKQLEGELTLLALGPLTNLAMALRLDADFGRRLARCVVMGGTSHYAGNMTAVAEFNFWFDPEAAHVAINELGCPITLLGIEVGLECAWPWDLFINSLLGKDSRCVQLIRDAEWNFLTRVRHPERNVTADAVCAAVLLRPGLVTAASSLSARVALQGEARGALLVDRRPPRSAEPWPSVSLVEAVDVQAFREAARELLQRLP